VLPNAKHEFSADWRAAQKGGPAGCTTGWASGVHIKAGRRAAHQAADKGSPPARPFPQPAPSFSTARRTALFSAENSRFSFGNTALQSAGPPVSVLQDTSLYTVTKIHF